MSEVKDKKLLELSKASSSLDSEKMSNESSFVQNKVVENLKVSKPLNLADNRFGKKFKEGESSRLGKGERVEMNGNKEMLKEENGQEEVKPFPNPLHQSEIVDKTSSQLIKNQKDGNLLKLINKPKIGFNPMEFSTYLTKSL